MTPTSSRLLAAADFHPAVASLVSVPDLVTVETTETEAVKFISIRYSSVPLSEGGLKLKAPMLASFSLSKSSGRIASSVSEIPGGSDLVADIAFGPRPTRPAGFALWHVDALVGPEAGRAPAEWRLTDVFASVTDTIERKISGAFQEHFRPHMSPMQLRTLTAFRKASLFDWETFDKVCGHKDTEALTAFIERHPLVGVQVLMTKDGFGCATDSDWDSYRPDAVGMRTTPSTSVTERTLANDLFAFSAARREVGKLADAGIRVGELGFLDGWSDALFRRAAGFVWENGIYGPPLSAFAGIPLDWFPTQEESGAFAQVVQAVRFSMREVPFGKEKSFADIVPGCGGRWIEYAGRLDEAAGGSLETIAAVLTSGDKSRHRLFPNGPLTQISRSFMRDILLPLGLLFAEEAPALASVVRLAVKGPAGPIGKLANGLLYAGMDLPGRHAFMKRYLDRKPAIAGVAARHPASETDPLGPWHAKGKHPSIAVTTEASGAMWSAWKAVAPRRLRDLDLKGLAIAIEKELVERHPKEIEESRSGLEMFAKWDREREEAADAPAVLQ